MRHFTRILFCVIFNSVFIFSSQAQLPRIQPLIDSLIVKVDTLEEQVAPRPVPSLENNIRKIGDYSRAINLITRTLEKGLDTARINEAIPRMERFVTNVDARLKENSNRPNLRLISALEYLVGLAEKRAAEVNQMINERMDELILAKAQFDSIKADDVMLYTLRDTLLLPEFQESLNDLKQKVSETDSILNLERIHTAEYQYKLAAISLQIENIGEIVKTEKRKIERNTYRREMNYIWNPSDFPKTERIADIFSQSFGFNFLIINSYLKEFPGLSIFLLIVILILYRWISRNLKQIRVNKEFSDIIFGRLKYVHKFPFLSAIMVVLAIAPFFYPNPPQSFSSFLLLMIVIASGFMIRKRVSSNAFRLWLLMFVLFLFNMLSKLYWDVAYQERWHLIVFNLLGIFVTLRFLKLVKVKDENIPPYFAPIVSVYVLFQVVSILANVLGRFSLSKMVGITGTLSMMHAVSLVIFVIIIKELIYIQVEVSRKDYAGYTSSLDFQGIQKRINSLFTVLAITIWGYYFLDSLYMLDLILDFSFEFLEKPRNILNASFTFAQVFVFVLAIYFAGFISNTVAFFASIKDEQYAGARSKRLGSSILLIRLGIFTLGIIIAFAASGIPVDKIAIVLGALSVGIGFGLQTIVNNLVSGIILAFERPIQIGDTVQVGQIEGIVKEIGIRSSKIKNWDGADIIIPNGDLLAHQLTNWTLSDKKRRVELIIGVAYHSDMDHVTKLIEEQLSVEGILHLPAPRVFLQTFADNSVNFRVLFWVDDVDVWVAIRDKVMRGIFKSFQENGVEIPFPQRDIYVKSFPGLIQENIIRPTELGKKEEKKTSANPSISTDDSKS
ncbi:Potassium efflux system KefA protein [Mariniradius saccharolyticus AK6]|uniref:Potassium efflux system KefA protein n=1 Tax=Mariniradius saccharolyticus AK6 TaxID=1239962 RepID=M7X9T6_9BACT|nr:mechanosensitive ion channel domain-containing protein [Mariniradius saccharolyticus]EMS31378.1 Potassium efflux system KefA protein [Mariniradius saccharolyticus AK6]